jgi:hypothetical protein
MSVESLTCGPCFISLPVSTRTSVIGMSMVSLKWVGCFTSLPVSTRICAHGTKKFREPLEGLIFLLAVDVLTKQILILFQRYPFVKRALR